MGFKGEEFQSAVREGRKFGKNHFESLYHVFQDGNKRTALATILTYFSDYEVECDEQKMTETVYKIAKKGIKDINKIVRLMENEILRR